MYTGELFIILLLSLMCTFIALLFLAIVTKNKTCESTFAPDISIIIPFYQEAHNLKKTISSIISQKYKAKIEIILINDRSSDNFNEIIKPFLNKSSIYRKVILVTSKFSHYSSLTPKQQAIECGIANTSYDFFLFTDADIYADDRWVSTMANSLTPKIDIVYGHTTIAPANNNFSYFQRFQLEFLFATAFAFSQAGLSGSCMGNNLLISRHCYSKIGGQKGIGATITEDRKIMQKALKQGFFAVPSTPFYSRVTTLPLSSGSTFLHQQLRWIKGGIQSGGITAIASFFFGLFHAFLPFFAFIGSLTINKMMLITYMILWVFTFFLFKITKSASNPLFFPFFTIGVVVESWILMASLIFVKPKWKGKVL